MSLVAMDIVVVNAVVMGVFALLLALASQFWRRPLWWGWMLPLGVMLAFGLRLLASGWAWSSLRSDPPWGLALLLAGWLAIGRTGALRLSSWPLVVLGAAVLGDELVAAGLALAEPDPARRARLVLAASGASLIGRISGAAPLVLGWGGAEVAVLGGVLALVGLVGGAASSTGAAPPIAWKDAPYSIGTGLVAGLAAWLLMLGGGLEFTAQGLELLPQRLPGLSNTVALLGGVLGGGLFSEGVVATAVSGVLERTLDVATEGYRQAALVGLAVGGGLPLLIATRSRLRVGLPLWLLQVVIALAWGAWRLG